GRDLSPRSAGEDQSEDAAHRPSPRSTARLARLVLGPLLGPPVRPRCCSSWPGRACDAPPLSTGAAASELPVRGRRTMDVDAPPGSVAGRGWGVTRYGGVTGYEVSRMTP